ncbi:MAG: hypothetical protein JO343_02615 [Candidatus Eremiobacteraeota bacterium]|nr:hypothetical protein [Candidatus Eremiobacteraeota bacterium]
MVVAHSLGSTISMDALLNLHNLVEEGGLESDQWRRIRAFVSLGTALEKTKFFFDAQNPGLSASYQQWRSDLYGHLFTSDFHALQRDNSAANPLTVGIYWANYWYYTDIVSNAIDSYRSDVQPGHALSALEPSPLQDAFSPAALEKMNVVAQNARLGSRFAVPNPLHIWVHSDYFGDDEFWRSGNDKVGTPYHGLLEILLTA